MFPQNLFFQIEKEGVYIKMEKSNSTQCNKNNKIRVDHKSKVALSLIVPKMDLLV